MVEDKRFSFSFYVRSLTRILGSPRRFFEELPETVGLQRSMGFLLVSALFFTGASLTCVREGPVLMAGILFLNAVGMTIIAAATGFAVVTLTLGRRIGFERLFAVYAFATGVTLLASWIPLFFWLTEPWKWLLIGIGMVNGCGLRRGQALLVIALSVAILVLFFWSLGPVIYRLKGAPA
ncbi:MAG: YIP1 family protein [Desulfobacterales bacterium]|nr:YIP1 family protein [Desulfobacterales bacterium]